MSCGGVLNYASPLALSPDFGRLQNLLDGIVCLGNSPAYPSTENRESLT